MQRTARAIAGLDALASLAQAARENGYVRPTLRPPGAPRRIAIVQGRHPVIERIALDEPFVPNDVLLDAAEQQILLITGPNMAGKSTVMRQVALIQLMAQAGSFVPARSAELSPADRLFTRVGAADNLARGQSTFLLEMIEAANILHHATAASLVILDEIGRGTSTFDGISIAWAMVEHLHQAGALTLFATHYHELTRLAQELERVRNFNVSIVEDGDRLAFTRKLVPGEADKSYGIQVARLAGLPAPVVARAHQVMDLLVAGNLPGGAAEPAGAGAAEGAEAAEGAGDGADKGGPAGKGGAARASGRKSRSRSGADHPGQLSMLAPDPAAQAERLVAEELRALDVNGLTPLEALNLLGRIKTRLTSDET